MGQDTKISWAHHTFNAALGCTKVSDGCKHCYAETFTKNRMGLKVWGNEPRRPMSAAYWKQPAKWNKLAIAAGERHRVFCGSMFDWCEDDYTVAAQVERLWPVIDATPQLDWLLLTKRPERIMQVMPPGILGYPNIWLGTSIEDMRVAWRADEFRNISAAVRFISYEPALGPLNEIDLSGIDWVIYGGESGPGRREDDVTWSLGMELICRTQHVAFWMKQRSGARPGEMDGRATVTRQLPVPRMEK